MNTKAVEFTREELEVIEYALMHARSPWRSTEFQATRYEACKKVMQAIDDFIAEVQHES